MDRRRQSRTARFAQLPYGTFTFRVIAANRDGVWNEQGAAVRIVVVPPFWRTPWFAALIFGGVAALALGVHRARIAHVRRQEALRAAFSRQLIDTQEGDRRRIAAGLHDGLSQNLIVIKNWALLGQKALPADHAARERLGEIEATAAQALGEVRDIVHDLAPHNLERLGLAPVDRDMVDKLQGVSGHPVQVPGRRAERHDAEAGADQPLPNRAGSHQQRREALRRGAGVDRNGRRRRACCACAVRDDGRGFDKDDEARAGAGGFGLFGMAERLRMIGGRCRSTPRRGAERASDRVADCRRTRS